MSKPYSELTERSKKTIQRNARKYTAKYYKQMVIRLRKDKSEDVELYEWLKSKPSYNKYIVDLIREDMMKHSK